MKTIRNKSKSPVVCKYDIVPVHHPFAFMSSNVYSEKYRVTRITIEPAAPTRECLAAVEKMAREAIAQAKADISIRWFTVPLELLKR